jgi:hypothetical protein
MKPLGYLRKKVVFTFPNGAAGADLIQSEVLALEGEILNIHQVNESNTNARTAKLVLTDEDAYELFDGTAKAHNANYDFEFGVTTRRILSGKNTLICTISGDPGVSEYEVAAVIYFKGRD